MSRSSLISLVLCLGVSVALFGWLFSSEPLSPDAYVKTTESGGQKNTGRKMTQVESVNPESAPSKTIEPNQREVVFSISRTKATPLNDEPVNIVINPGSQKVQIQPGAGDLVVTASGLRMRSEPSSKSELLGNYARGARFTHIRDQNGWALVQSLDDGQKGWMFKKYMGAGG